jgi:hypothetical protein
MPALPPTGDRWWCGYLRVRESSRPVELEKLEKDEPFAPTLTSNLILYFKKDYSVDVNTVATYCK